MFLRPLFRRQDGTLNPVGFIVLGMVAVGSALLLSFLAFQGFWIYDFRVHGPNGARVQGELEKEFQQIQPLPNATSQRFHASHKTRQALASDTYRTRSPYAEIRNFYDQELKKHGWTFYEEEPMKDWGKDLGGKTARYCKGEYRAALQYAGERADYRWDYAFSVSWGLDAIFEKHPEDFYKGGCK